MSSLIKLISQNIQYVVDKPTVRFYIIFLSNRLFSASQSCEALLVRFPTEFVSCNPVLNTLVSGGSITTASSSSPLIAPALGVYVSCSIVSLRAVFKANKLVHISAAHISDIVILLLLYHCLIQFRDCITYTSYANCI